MSPLIGAEQLYHLLFDDIKPASQENIVKLKSDKWAAIV